MKLHRIKNHLARQYLNRNYKPYIRICMMDENIFQTLKLDAQRHHPNEQENEIEARAYYRYACLYPFSWKLPLLGIILAPVLLTFLLWMLTK